jgi:hypothetical protein
MFTSPQMEWHNAMYQSVPRCCAMLSYLANKAVVTIYLFIETLWINFRSRTWTLYILHEIKNQTCIQWNLFSNILMGIRNWNV